MTADWAGPWDAQPVEWDGHVIALVVRGGKGDFLVPPIMLSRDEKPLLGAELLEAIVQTGVGVPLPVIRDCEVGDVAEMEQRLAKISDTLGVDMLRDVSALDLADPDVEEVASKVRKAGRNELCPCGSGRKYKHCHGGAS